MQLLLFCIGGEKNLLLVIHALLVDSGCHLPQWQPVEIKPNTHQKFIQASQHPPWTSFSYLAHVK